MAPSYEPAAIDATPAFAQKQTRMILFDTQNFLPDVGGTQLYVTGLADALAARGHGIEVYCDATSAEAAARIDAARAYPIARFAGPRPWMRWNKARRVMARLAKGDVQAVVTDTWKSLSPLKPDALRNVRVLCLGHGNEFLQMPGSTKERRMIAALAKADIVAANSQFTAGIAEPFARGKTRVTLPGVIPPAGASREFAPRASNENPKLLTIARLEPRKGVDMVLRALPALRAAHPGLIYDIVGKGADRARLENLVQELGVAAAVRFHAYVSENEKANFLKNADIFLLPNRREGTSVEGFGIVFQEAAAFGVPSIAGADGGTGDAVIAGQTGLIVDGEKSEAVRDAVLELLTNGNLRNTMAAAAHKRFWDEFAWDAAIARFEKALLG
jgi:phosphatidylinositol alpha-1,6-mannosyltransferase